MIFLHIGLNRKPAWCNLKKKKMTSELDTQGPQVQYFDCDFDAEEWIRECAGRPLPLIQPEPEKDEAVQWNSFFYTHCGGQFFKARKYIYPAYRQWLEKSNVCLEVGCGYGCSIFPLMDINSLSHLRIVATDYSSEALSILLRNAQFDPSRIIDVRAWDITHHHLNSCKFSLDYEEALERNERENESVFPSVDSILCLFVLSAIHSDSHEIALRNMWSILPIGGVVLFRDYGICDMTMFRHRSRLSQNLFRRNDGTLSYYFDLDYLNHLCSRVGFDPVQLKYATVEVTNKKKKISMRRVFVHAVLVKMAH